MNIKIRILKEKSDEKLEERLNEYLKNVDGNSIMDIKYYPVFNGDPGVSCVEYTALVMIKFN